jgi:predicted glycogen debranching enzyme
VTNGLGGFASGTVAGVVTRRYHGLLVAALPVPLGRTIMLNHLLERVRLPGGDVRWLGDEDEVAGPNAMDRTEHLVAFRLENGLPVWTYHVGPAVIEKRVVMPYGQNTVHVSYRLREADQSVRLTLRPSVHFRSYEAPVDAASTLEYRVVADGAKYEVCAEGLPALRLMLHGRKAGLMLEEKGASEVPYEIEASRGYESVGSLWSPGYFRADLTARTRPSHWSRPPRPWDLMAAISPEQAQSAEQQRRRRLLAMAGNPRHRSRPNSSSPPISSSSRQPGGREEAARRGRPATMCGRSSPGTTGSPTGAATR